MLVYNLDTKPFWKSEVDDIDTVEDISKKLPWFLECNPERFPYWWVLKSKKYHIFSATNETDFCRFGKPDPRNVQLLAAMHSGSKKDPKPLVSTYDFIWRWYLEKWLRPWCLHMTTLSAYYWAPPKKNPGKTCSWIISVPIKNHLEEAGDSRYEALDEI